MRRVERAARSVRAFCMVIVWLSINGCGHNMKVAPVSGTVTLDGAPLKRASVLFEPEAGGRPSFGVTDQNGKYTLAYSMHEGGAEVGSCTVKITTLLKDDEDADGNPVQNSKSAAEQVPERYAREPIVVKVEARSNTIDIALTSKP